MKTTNNLDAEKRNNKNGKLASVLSLYLAFAVLCACASTLFVVLMAA